MNDTTTQGHAFSSPAAREADRRAIAQDVDAFLARGGQVRELPILTDEERETVDQGWTSSLGRLSKRQGEYTVKPGWQDRPREKSRPHVVRITREGETLEFATGIEAAEHIGSSRAMVYRAAAKGWRVQGWTVEYVYDSALLLRPGSGRQRRSYRCADCQSTDESNRYSDRLLCKRCYRARRRAKQAEMEPDKAKYFGRRVRLIKGQESRAFDSDSEAAKFLGVSQGAVSSAVSRNHRVAGWTARRVAG